MAAHACRCLPGAREYELELTQRFQEVRGGARVAGGYLPAFDARLSGERIAFVLSTTT